MGVSSESGFLDDSRMSRTFLAGTPVRCASSSGVGSRPISLTRFRFTREIRFRVSTMWTGMRIVREWSAIARVIAWRIHQVAYVENLKPRRYWNRSTAFMSPMLPSWTRSSRERSLPR